MNIQRIFLRWALVAVFPLFLLGCSTPESRIRKNPHLFNPLTESQKEQVREGRLSLGDTENMVYLALGRPDRKTVRSSAKGEEQIWIYTGTHAGGPCKQSHVVCLLRGTPRAALPPAWRYFHRDGVSRIRCRADCVQRRKGFLVRGAATLRAVGLICSLASRSR